MIAERVQVRFSAMLARTRAVSSSGLPSHDESQGALPELACTKERVAQTRYLRQRLNQAFRYLDGLLEGKRVSAPVCPNCTKPYVRVSGQSPTGRVYFHADRSECRTA
jgi:hypothetical protein